MLKIAALLLLIGTTSVVADDLPFSKGDAIMVTGFLCEDVSSAEKVITIVNKPDIDDATLLSTIHDEQIPCQFGHGVLQFQGTVAKFIAGDTEYGIDSFMLGDTLHYSWHAMNGQPI